MATSKKSRKAKRKNSSKKSVSTAAKAEKVETTPKVENEVIDKTPENEVEEIETDNNDEIESETVDEKEEVENSTESDDEDDKEEFTKAKSAEALEKAKEIKEAEISEVKTKVVASETTKDLFKGFFARKFDDNENILTIFKSPKIFGALLGELIGTMLLAMFLLTIGIQPLYIIFGTICITLAVFKLSGANLNPLITVGMMASRRMSAIRGVLYILAQIIGAWLGLLIINAFRLGSGTSVELPKMAEITGNTFWVVTLVEFVGAIALGFFFSRALRYKKSPLTFALTVVSGMTFIIIFGLVVSQSFFQLSSTFIFNPAIALMYQILPNVASGFGELIGNVALALSAYVVFPMLGGTLGFYLADFAGRFIGEKGRCDDCCCKKD